MTDIDREMLRTTFGQDAELYDQCRPSYPPQLFTDLAALAGLGPRARVLEIGCGTGQATLPLAQLGSPEYLNLLMTYSGHRAIEPQARSDLFTCIIHRIDNVYNGQIIEQYRTRLAICGDWQIAEDAVSGATVRWFAAPAVRTRGRDHCGRRRLPTCSSSIM